MQVNKSFLQENNLSAVIVRGVVKTLNNIDYINDGSRNQYTVICVNMYNEIVGIVDSGLEFEEAVEIMSEIYELTSEDFIIEEIED